MLFVLFHVPIETLIASQLCLGGHGKQHSDSIGTEATKY
jgi:hypothetical protein